MKIDYLALSLFITHFLHVRKSQQIALKNEFDNIANLIKKLNKVTI